ncbi:MAG: tetrathionate reductase family octaheme c-type cytochrome [Ignavibacteria bacterium]|nr:tetrathionate reductase family octaheme c-type cytochrome [Ignavibacteria bacterium]MCC7158400.1 tetrathionate reductase family octaheme c-type cytochrome [Ignavibacteria bacterium]
MRKIFFLITLIAVIVMSILAIILPKHSDNESLKELKEKLAAKDSIPADHTKFEVLQKKFNAPSDVTETCLSCHTERGKEVMRSSHWNWERQEYIKGKGIVSIGKKNAINNFCIGVEGNEQSCAKCHIGFGMTDSMFSYTDQKNIDCMVCHDNTETYVKGNERSGYPDAELDLQKIATGIGKPKRSNCGVCHFFGGGGNNVKHGDLEKSMFEPTKEVDVHMASEGPDMQCIDCHVTKEHQMLGRVYSLSSMNKNRSECEQCHTENPHKEDILNEHTLKVACQTCHIPIYAKVNSTKMEWDWSTAGQLRDGIPFEEEDSLGNHSYLSIKGSFKWERNLKPDYIWFNGTADHYLLGDRIEDTSGVLLLNKLNGSYIDKSSKIIPVKIHKAKQPFDPVTGMLLQPKLFGKKTGEGAFWKDFDWARASEVGMKEVGLPFSGRVSFIRTEMFWPVNHMVSKKEESLKCTDCHTSSNSRLAGVPGFYMPARDRSSIIDYSGMAIILLTIFGVMVHLSVRIYSSLKRKIK